MNSEKVIHNFWSSFGVKAYDELSVPDKATPPYITYNVITGTFGSEVLLNASIWSRSTSWVELVNLKEEISQRLGLGGIILSHDEGGLWIKKATPFAQRMGDESDKDIKRIYMNVSVEFI